MHRHPDYTRKRIAQVCERLRGRIRCEVCEPVRLEVAGPVGRIPAADAEALEYRPAHLGEQFGPLWATYWFRIEAVVPKEWAGERVDLLWVSHSESTLWRNGTPLQGLNTSHEGARPDALLLERAAGGERLDLRVELACNGKFGQMERPYETVEPVVLDQCLIARFDPLAWRLFCDMDVLRRVEADGAAHGDLDPAWGGRLLAGLNHFCNAWDEDDRGTWEEAGETLAELLAARNGTVAHRLSAIGHAHIDTAWLWPLAETHRKLVRTFSSQLAYMERYPEFRFACSQAYQYDWIRQNHPDMYARIRERAAAGQWVPCGGTWIEPDCNLPSGESLVRQFLYGQRYFEREFGRRHREFWNPDVFGYNAQLPQIMRGAGIERFLTQKLSWNRFTWPEHHTFDWEAPDGSRVLTHFPPADTYNATADADELRRNVRAHHDHDYSDRSLLVFGYGDGGGGPTPGMLESLRRVGDLQGVPRTAIQTPEEFFTALDAAAPDRPVVVGELYLELHRGTYTTQGAVKRGNRAGERALHDAELLAAVAHRLGAGEYPSARLDSAWRLLLLNQFHDILPGSSIGQVYQDAARDHAEVLETAEGVVLEAARRLGGGGEPVPVQTLGAARRQVASHPHGGLVWVEAEGCGPGRVAEAPDAVEVDERDDAVVLRNAHLEAVLGRDGTLRSLVHRGTRREALAGRGNVLQLFEDRPVDWDAWDVDPFHLETERDNGPARRCTVAARGPLRAEVELEFGVGAASTLTQLVRLDAGAACLEFHTLVDWRERHTLLKVLFEVDVRSTAATYQMQFGATARPTHFSTQRELAQFEVPGHRFSDLSESGFGVALLTDCKYGYSTHQNQMRISLLRSPAAPDPAADIGEHRFAYAVMPHAGDWREGGVVAAAGAFESPVRWIDGPIEQRPWVAVSDANLVLDTVKRAEDSDALVLRLYEAHGARGTAVLTLGVPFARARLANLLEDPDAELTLTGGAIEVPYGPHQIVTVMVD